MNLGYAVIANAMILVFELDELEECKILDRISLDQDEDFIEDELLEWEEQAETFQLVTL